MVEVGGMVVTVVACVIETRVTAVVSETVVTLSEGVVVVIVDVVDDYDADEAGVDAVYAAVAVVAT